MRGARCHHHSGAHRANGPQRLGDDPDIEGHGFLWWITTVDDHAGFAATGWGGQLLEVVPARRLVAPAINPS